MRSDVFETRTVKNKKEKVGTVQFLACDVWHPRKGVCLKRRRAHRFPSKVVKPVFESKFTKTIQTLMPEIFKINLNC